MSAPVDMDLGGLPPALGAWYASHLGKVGTAWAAMERIVQAGIPPVRARLVRSTQLGAEALKSRGGYEVRLTVALPTIIHFTFNCLLRTPQFMYGVGDAVSEQPYRTSSTRIPLSLPRGIALEKAIVSITALSRPADERRAAAAALLTELAVAFCAYHELAHLLLGHIDAMQRWSGRARLLEMAERTGVSQPDGKTRLVWEYEADLVAANMLLQDMMDPGVEGVFKEVYGPIAETDALSRFQAMLGATLVVFLLISQVTPRDRRTHPEPLVRFAAIANDSAAALAEQQPQLKLSFQDAGEAVNDVALSTLSGWRALGLGTSAASPLKNLMTAQRAVERLEKHRGAGHQAYSRFAQFYPFR